MEVRQGVGKLQNLEGDSKSRTSFSAVCFSLFGEKSVEEGLVEPIRELTKRRRRRQRRRYKTMGLVRKNNGSARSARAFYILVHFFAVIS